jgi:ATP-binding cassette subfamily B protein
VGSGKTTLLRLILGLCEPCSGSICLGGENILDFNKTSLLENISYVSQKSAVFSGSFKSNLTLGSENFDETELQNALKVVKLEDLVAEKGLETPILQQGKNLSGGQKQRLALARNLLKKSRIYIFDDSFSSLDFKTEAEVRNEISKKLCGKTLIFVSQRISTIKNADKIIVLNDGKIAVIGTHDELLKSCEIYKKTANLQNGGETLNEK